VVFSFMYAKSVVIGGLSVKNVSVAGRSINFRLVNDGSKSGAVIIKVRGKDVVYCDGFTNIQENRTRDIYFSCQNSIPEGTDVYISASWASGNLESYSQID